MALGIAVLSIGWALVGLFSFYFIYIYGHRSSLRWYHIITVYSGLFFSMSIVFLLPMDLSLASYLGCVTRKESPLCSLPFLCNLPSSLFYWSWRLIYWNAFVLTWLVIPFLKNFAASGEWGTLRRCKDALRRNTIYYGVTLGCLFVFMLYLWIQATICTWHGMVAFLMASSNAYGLVLVVCFMSYGLVMTPKRLWATAFPEDELKRLYCIVVQAKEELDDAQAQIEELIDKIEQVSQHIPNEQPHRILADDLLLQLAHYMDAKQGSGAVASVEERRGLFGHSAAVHQALRKKYNGDESLRGELVRLHRKLGKSFRFLYQSEG